MWIFATVVLFATVGSPVTIKKTEAVHRTPVILVPGDGGTQIYAKYDNWDFLCPGGSSWFLIWVNLKFLLPFTEYCMSRYFKLSYNATTRRTYNQEGVQTRIEGWGNTSTIDYLDSRHYSFLTYYGDIVSALKDNGFQSGLNMFGAPYDFRKAPNENVDFVPKMKKLVETAFLMNNRTRVMLAGHSMGNLYVLYFLRQMDHQWKKTYVRGYFAISAPVGGAVKSVRAETSGDAINSAVIFITPIRTVLRSMPSTIFLFPRPGFWAPDEVVASRPGRNYTVSNYADLFKDMNYADGASMFEDVYNLYDPRWFPDVDELYCGHGIDIDTPEVLVWEDDSSFPDYQPDVKYGDGDGTVNLRSLRGCTKWAGVRHYEYSGAEHVATLRDPRLIRDLLNVLIRKD